VKKIVIMACLFVFALTLPAAATPSTLIWIPSTDIQPTGKTHFGIDNYFTVKPLNGASTGAFTTPTYGLTWGGKNFEFGIDYVASQDKPLYFNFKYLVAGKKPTDLNVAVGVYNVGQASSTNQEIKYALTSITDNNGWRYTLGYGWGRKEVLGADHNMVLAGIDKQLNDKWWVAVDYQGGKSSMGALSFGVGYTFAPNASVILGYNIYNDRNLRNTVTTQLDINF
jgi:hypothetical protein